MATATGRGWVRAGRWLAFGPAALATVAGGACGGVTPPAAPTQEGGSACGPAGRPLDDRAELDASVPLVGPLPEGAPVRRLVVRAPGGVPTPLLLELLETREGHPLRRDALQRDLRRLYSLTTFEDVAVDATLETGGLTLTFLLRPRARVSRSTVEGARDDAHAARLRPTPGGLFDPSDLFARAELVEEELAADGYRHARVEVRATPGRAGDVDVCVRVEPGPKLLLTRVEIVGVDAELGRALRETIDTREHLVNAEGAPLRMDMLEVDRLRMLAALYDRGRLLAEIEAPRVKEDAARGEVTVELVVHEGPEFLLGDVGVQGRTVAPESVYRELLGLRSGDVFNRTRIVDGIAKIRALHRSVVGADVQVTPQSEVHHEERRVDLVLVLD
jgi:outer membrane protein insertion porin family